MSSGPLRYHQPMTMTTRVVLGFAACIPLLGFYELLVRPGMDWLQWGMAPFLVMGFAALGFGLFFLGAAIFGGSRTVTIDRGTRMVVVEFDGTFGAHYRFVHPFTYFGAPFAAELPSSDGPRNWAVELPNITTNKKLLIHSYAEEASARAEAARVAAYIAGH